MFLYLLQVIPLTIALAPNSWQKRLDRALLDIDGARTPQARFRLIQRALQDPALQKDVKIGIEAIQTDGFGKGHPTFIEKVWPKGTIARSDIEGIQALIKTIPERVDEISRSDASFKNMFLSTSRSFQSKYISKAIQKTLEFEDPVQSLTLAQNVFRRDPKKVETLTSTKLAVILDSNVEIRQFDSFEMVTSTMGSSENFTLANMGDGLAKLSSYILGYNSQEVISSMTIPFVIHKSNMWIKRPSNMVDIEPIDTAVTIRQRQSETFALVEFSGICTNSEVERQKNILLEALSHDENIWNIVDYSIFVLQYNPPGTLPWRRKNEVGLLVQPNSHLSTNKATTKSARGNEEVTIDDEHTVVSQETVEDANKKDETLSILENEEDGQIDLDITKENQPDGNV